ncbi:MAG TPA: hypothetical protein VHB48_13125 [Chitinophagaceae bacterium]|nr:hypothetical protein [Chitinophagaceae bacterium]
MGVIFALLKLIISKKQVVSIFKEKSTPAVFGLILLALALHASFLNKPPLVITNINEGLLYYALAPLSHAPAVVLSIIYYLIVLVQALRINYMLNDVRMYQKSSFTASLGYIMLTALLPAWGSITAALVVNSLIIWLLFRVVKLYNSQQPKTLVYNIGLIAGCMVLLYYPALFFIPVLFFALGITRPFRLNEWFVLLMGIITPAYFFAGYLFLSSDVAVYHAFAGNFVPQKTFPAKIVPTAVAFGAAGILIITGIIVWQAQNKRMQIQVRKMWSILFIMLILMVPAIFFMKNAWPFALLLACVPGAAFAGNAFLYPGRLASALLFWVIIAAIIYVTWMPFKI